ncbi:unnamed protein product, partial [Mesorhabditis spiculigera]
MDFTPIISEWELMQELWQQPSIWIRKQDADLLDPPILPSNQIRLWRHNRKLFTIIPRELNSPEYELEGMTPLINSQAYQVFHGRRVIYATKHSLSNWSRDFLADFLRRDVNSPDSPDLDPSAVNDAMQESTGADGVAALESAAEKLCRDMSYYTYNSGELEMEELVHIYRQVRGEGDTGEFTHVAGGGQGTVYKWEREAPVPALAVKLMILSRDPEIRAREVKRVRTELRICDHLRGQCEYVVVIR